MCIRQGVELVVAIVICVLLPVQALTEPMKWGQIPGRPLQIHSGAQVTFDRVISHRERMATHRFRDDASVNMRQSVPSDGKLQPYVVKVHHDRRMQARASIRNLVADARIQYLPYDAFVVPLTANVAEQIADLSDILAVFVLPSQMKVAPDLLEEVFSGAFAPSIVSIEHDDGSPRPIMYSNNPVEEYDGSNDLSSTSNSNDPRMTSATILTEKLRVTVTSDQAELAVMWRLELRAAGLDVHDISIADSSPHDIDVIIDGENGAVAPTVRWLAKQSQVLWVERKAELTAHKIDHASFTVTNDKLRNNVRELTPLIGNITRTGNSTEPLLWSRGLRGENQVIAIADSGLDFDNCAYSDDRGNDLSLIPVCLDSEVCENPGRHRKVFSYRRWNNSTIGDALAGHGTHVAGSAAADVVDPKSPFQLHGIAPSAKIAFEDGQNNPPGVAPGRGLNFPPTSVLFLPSIAQGVKIHSNSWSEGHGVYHTSAQQVDQTMWDNDDFLVVFSAGNFGGFGYRSVASPSLAKNGISVGAAENVDSAYAYNEKGAFIQLTIAADSVGSFIPTQFAFFGMALPPQPQVLWQVVQVLTDDADPTFGCGNITNRQQVNGSLALMRRGKCFFQRKCFNAQAAGAVGCLVANNEPGSDRLFRMWSAEDTVTIPSMFVTTAGGDSLQALLNQGDVRVTLPFYEPKSEENVASFSSRGPTFDMRLKPDVVAIGENVLSGRADNDLTSYQCTDETAARKTSGTSMSCPMVAGAAALVRQYFEMGYHVDGYADISKGYSPSAALVKAVLLHSGQQMSFPKARPTSTNSELFPNFDQGYGRIELPSTLWFKEESNHNLFFVDRQHIADKGQWNFCFQNVQESSPLKVTLHWTDPPGSLSSKYYLVHNLDLSVIHQSGTKYGNAVPGVDSSGAYVPLLDSTNNNEQVTWTSPPIGEYRVVVTARDVPLGAQNFSLVATGKFDSASACAAPRSCPGNCSGNGVCLANGACRCFVTHAGADCSSRNGVLTSLVRVTTPPITVSGWLYYTFFVAPGDEWSIEARSLDTTMESDPDLYVAFNRVPALDDFDASNVSRPELTNLSLHSAGLSSVQIPPSGGAFVLGINAFCCQAAQLQVMVNVTSTRTTTTSTTPMSTSSSTTAPTTTSATQTSSTTSTTAISTTTTASSAVRTPTTSPAGTPEPAYNLVVDIPGEYRSLNLVLNSSLTVEEVKKMIAKQTGYALFLDSIYLFFNRQQLESGRTLASYNIASGDVVQAGFCPVSTCTPEELLREPRACKEADARKCHAGAYCDDFVRFTDCTCPEGSIGDGLADGSGCSPESWTLQLNLDLESPPLTADGTRLEFWERDRAQLTNLLFSNFTSEKPCWFDTAAYHTITERRYVSVFALFFTKAEAEAALAALHNNTATSRRMGLPNMQLPRSLFGVGNLRLLFEPTVHTFVSETSDSELQILPTGMDVQNVYFRHDCLQHGCWVIDVIFTAGLVGDDFNVFFIPNAVGNDTVPDFDYTTIPAYGLPYGKSPFDTFLPSSFPCGSDGYRYDRKPGADIADRVSACCIEEFTEMYRPVESFLADPQVSDVLGTSRDTFCGVNQTRKIYNRTHMPESALFGNFSGMDGLGRVDFGRVLNPFIGQGTATVYLDEVALRQRAGVFKGTVGVQHSIDTFIGFANFKPTGLEFLDMFAAQTNIHLEKTNFFTVSAYGENEYTFLEYVNLRLVAIYEEDENPVREYDQYGNPFFRTNRTHAAQYLQVTFTLGEQYQPIETGIIPVDSVLISKGDFIASADTISSRFHACQQYLDNTLPQQQIFDSRFPSADSQTCAPNATMCYNPPAIPDQFVMFNIPLGVDWLPEPSNNLDNNVFVDLVVSVIDAHQIARPNAFPNHGDPAEQMKTTLKASIPVVEGGVYNFCDRIIAKTDLYDVASVDLILGSAGFEHEFSRLQILRDIGTSGGIVQDDGVFFETDSIEAGLMTLVIKGNESYFRTSITHSLEVEDIITVHVMEPETGTKYNRVLDLLRSPGQGSAFLNGNGFELNGAFSVVVDRAENRAALQPSTSLQQLCPFLAQRPSPDDYFPETCIVRRDIRARNFLNTTNKAATAIELPPQNISLDDPARSGVAQFMQLVLNPSDYSAELGRNYSYIVAQKYALNGRFNRAYWINPAYEWTPRQTGGTEIFQLSQKVVLFALISIDEEFSGRRRMLLQSSDAIRNSGSAAPGTAVIFDTSPRSLMASLFNVPQELVALFSVEIQLTNQQACMSGSEIRHALRSLLDEYAGVTTTHHETVQLTTLTLDMANVQCPTERRRLSLSRRLQEYSAATATAEMMVVFSPSDYVAINLQKFGSLPGINSVSTLLMSDTIQVSTEEDFVPSQVYRPSTYTPDVEQDAQITPSDLARDPQTSSVSPSPVTIVIVVAVGLVTMAAGYLFYSRMAARNREHEAEFIKDYGVDDIRAELALP